MEMYCVDEENKRCVTVYVPTHIGANLEHRNSMYINYLKY